jgi:hypothetical protein
MVEVFFEKIENVLIKYLEKANHEIIIVVAWINTSIFQNTFYKLLKNNIKITIVYNDDFINKKTVKKIEGIKYIPIKMPRIKNKMHNKFCIIDNQYAISGSYNWSLNASRNFENIIITDDLKTVCQFILEYNKFININLLYDDAKNIGRCEHCSGKTIVLAVLRNEDYYNCVDSLMLYDVCTKDEKHYKFIYDVYFCNITNSLDVDILESPPNEFTSEEEEMIIKEFEREKDIFSVLQHVRTNNEYNTSFHAIAVNTVTNFNKYMQGYDEEEAQCLNVIWKNRFLSNIIKNKYYFLAEEE